MVWTPAIDKLSACNFLSVRPERLIGRPQLYIKQAALTHGWDDTNPKIMRSSICVKMKAKFLSDLGPQHREPRNKCDAAATEEYQSVTVRLLRSV